MSNADYIKALEAAQKELVETLNQRSVIDQRINQLKTTIDVLLKMTSDVPVVESGALDPELGISDAIRHILNASHTPLTPSEIRSGLNQSGFELSGYANAGAVVHNTLKRLSDQGEIIVMFGDTGKLTYAMKPAPSPLEPAPRRRFNKI